MHVSVENKRERESGSGCVGCGSLRSGQCRESPLGCSMSCRGRVSVVCVSLVDALIMRGGAMMVYVPSMLCVDEGVSECAGVVTGDSSSPPSAPWREGAAGFRCATHLHLHFQGCATPPPPPPVHPRSTIPIPHPTHLTPHLLLLSEQSQPAIACAIFCLVSKIRQRIAAYKYPASPHLAAAFPTLHPSYVSVSASGTLGPPHGPDHQALGLRLRD